MNRIYGKSKWLILAMFVLLCVLVAIAFDAEAPSELAVEIQSGGKTERILSWQSDQDVYVFLPAYADGSSAKVFANGAKEIAINGETVGEGIDFSNLQFNVPYELSSHMHGREEKKSLTFVRSENVAAMFIDTESGDVNYIHAQKGNAEKGNIRLYRADGGLEYDGELNSIVGRGNTTWDEQEKKPYNIELVEETDLLDMGAARDWVLLANAYDAAGLRNKIVFDFASEAGLLYSPESRWVDLYLNGEYAGLYLLCEQNEVHAQRVDIEGENSFLVSVERHGRMVTQNLPYVETEANQTLRIRYPKVLTEQIQSEISDRWQTTENAILSEEGIDPVTGMHWLELIDLDSWVRKYLVEEIFGSTDASYISQFFYYDGNAESSRIFAGPVWDYDQSMGNTWQSSAGDGLYANRLHVNEEHDTPWFYELYNKYEFYDRMTEIFEAEFLPLLLELRDEKIEMYAADIAAASRMNGIRWSLTSEDIQADVDTIQEFISGRIEFLQNLWLKNQKYHVVEARSTGAKHAYFAVKDGEGIGSLPVIEDSSVSKFEGWYYENGESVDYAAPVSGDIRVVARWSGRNVYLTAYAQYFVPLAVIAALGAGLLIMEIWRSRRGV